jgi:Copper amine oxidase N-terminal domain
MKPLIKSTALAIAAVLAMTATISSIGAADQTVSVSVNGTPVTFDQPPIERNGRVFVPLRGVFEQLGATVTYDNGNIVAIGNGRTIDLNVGSTTAVVNGTQQQLDVAPFLIGARTLVPLRFVSQALGAYVEWDQSTNSVAITSGQGAPAQVSQIVLNNERPASNAVVPARRPAVSAQFSQAVDPNSVKVTLDDRDVSQTTYVSSSGFLFSPPYDLGASVHTVRVSGKSADDGTPFTDYWSFTSGTSAQSNYITNVSPPNGTGLTSGSFTVSGTTLPYATVHIAVVGSASVGGMFRVNTGSYSADVSADSSGQFSQTVNINTVAGGQVGVRITSTAPATNAGATVTVIYNT